MAVQDIRAARRYASALFSAAQKLDELETVERDLSEVNSAMNDTPTLRNLWDSKVVPAGKKRRLIEEILKPNVHSLTLGFLLLIIDKRREDLFDPILEEMQRLSDFAHHLVRADATFALEPTEAQRAALVESLEQRSGNKVDLTVHVDPSIMGGVIVRLQDNIIDGSVRGTLDRLRERLLQEA